MAVYSGLSRSVFEVCFKKESDEAVKKFETGTVKKESGETCDVDTPHRRLCSVIGALSKAKSLLSVHGSTVGHQELYADMLFCLSLACLLQDGASAILLPG